MKIIQIIKVFGWVFVVVGAVLISPLAELVIPADAVCWAPRGASTAPHCYLRVVHGETALFAVDAAVVHVLAGATVCLVGTMLLLLGWFLRSRFVK